MRVSCGICEKPAKARCNGKNGGPLWETPLCGGHYERLRRYGNPNGSKKKGPEKGKTSRRIIGTRYPKGDGYIKVWNPEHPNANKNGWVAEHTLIMSEKLHRPLLEGESVHHLNGVKDDNRPENLELWVRPPRNGVRFQDAILDSIAFLEQYGYKVYIPFNRTCE